MKSIIIFLAASAALIHPIAAHYQFTQLIVNNTVTDSTLYVRQHTNGRYPVSDVTSLDLRCNIGGLASGATTSTATVVAGSTVGFHIGNGDTIVHPGPLLVYMAKAPSTAASFDGSGQVWFKIYEVGADINGGYATWPAQSLDQVTFPIPAAVPSGEYLLRIEHIGLHVAALLNGSQHHISCANINIVGGGSGSPTPLVALPGAYSPRDPALFINLFWPPLESYTPPGPPVWP
ncbi:hypothetical protein FRC02_007619 [Tulasnella sp. 418]|nr:hypothetical protein FRC02_007619 [Tulasnella sp. 418]